MKKLNKVVMVIAKICEIAHWFLSAFCFIALMIMIFNPKILIAINSQDQSKSLNDLQTGSFSISPYLNDGSFSVTAVIIFCILAIMTLSLTAMVFRNVYLICRTANGKTKFSQGTTMFQKDITRMVREIGIFLISGNIIGNIVCVIALAVLGWENIEVSMGNQTLFIGLIILYLSSVFDYGYKLQKDVDGLL